MPLYTYECDDCGEFSAWARMDESGTAQPCPACAEPGQRALARPSLGGRQAEASGAYCGPSGCGDSQSFGGMGGGCGCGAGGCAH